MFAYGATGAGKTYTMLGAKEEPGVIFRSEFTLKERMLISVRIASDFVHEIVHVAFEVCLHL